MILISGNSIIINERGQILAFQLTPGNVSDVYVVEIYTTRG
jgi:hypothetical protein